MMVKQRWLTLITYWQSLLFYFSTERGSKRPPLEWKGQDCVCSHEPDVDCKW